LAFGVGGHVYVGSQIAGFRWAHFTSFQIWDADDGIPLSNGVGRRPRCPNLFRQIATL
jgi:hypothetical protein